MSVLETLSAEWRSVLVVGAHADDIEIGCAGTIRRLAGSTRPPSVRWVVLSAEGVRADEAIDGAHRVAGGTNLEIEILGFRERFFPYLPELKEWFDTLASGFRPDLVICPWIGDAHQDHAHTGRVVHQTFREQTILEYEIPKRDGDLGRPSVYVPLSEVEMDWKVDVLLGSFASQRERGWFDEETFRGISRLRGVEAGSGRWAEAFHCGRLVLR
jgi:LmbE family N-acetylglucosaminyl deacetylase